MYDAIFPSSIGESLGEMGKRNTDIDRRDDVLACRYYYHAHIIRRRYDDCMLQLNIEFYISPNVIVQRLAGRTEKIKSLVKSNATATDLRKAYPHFSWA